MRILAIDPGSEKSAWVVFNGKRPVDFGIADNEELIQVLKGRSMPDLNWDHLAIEFIASYGQRVGRSVFETLFWTGRFVEAWGGEWTPVYRKEIVKFLCGGAGKDKDVRAALIRLYGETDPPSGPLRSVVKDMWAALAVAVYSYHLHQEESGAE